MAKEVGIHALLHIAQLLFEAADQIDDAAATMPEHGSASFATTAG